MLFIVTLHTHSIRHRKALLIAFYSLSIVCFLQAYKASAPLVLSVRTIRDKHPAPYVLNLHTMTKKGGKLNYNSSTNMELKST